jgi:hypothetical protein
MPATPPGIVASVARVFESLAIPYLVGGSVASSTYGPPRSTLHADIVANFGPSVVPALVVGLSADFHVDEAMIRTALERRDSFNQSYLDTGADPMGVDDLLRTARANVSGSLSWPRSRRLVRRLRER